MARARARVRVTGRVRVRVRVRASAGPTRRSVLGLHRKRSRPWPTCPRILVRGRGKGSLG